MNFIVYANATGRILRSGSCANELIAAQARDSETALESDAQAETHYVVAGVVTAKPQRPSEHHQFDYTIRRWVDPRTPSDRRRSDYPPITDQLDALWKGGADADTMRAKVMAIKARYPK